MTIETEVANLTTQTTALLNAVNVSKATLDQKVVVATDQAAIATTKAGESSASADTATTKAAAAEAARAAAVTAQNNAVAVVTGGTGSLVAAPGKLPLADAAGKLDMTWFATIMPLFGELMPLILFGSNQQGALYDPSNISTLFQDSAFTTPVTAVERPVGGMLDLSGRGNHASMATTTKRPAYSRRVNLLTKTEQFDDAAWGKTLCSVTPNSSIAPDGNLTADLIIPGASSGVRYVSIAGSGNSIYKVRIKNGGLRYAAFGNAAAMTVVDLDSGTISTTSKGGMSFAITGLGDGWCEVTCTNPTATAYQYQLFAGVDGTGGNIATDGVAGILAWGASITLAADAHIPYQRVNTATDYDADPAKFPAYLRFDGVDDSLACGTGGGGSAGFFFSSVVCPLGSAGTNRTLFSDAGTNTGYIVRLNTSNRLELSAGNGTAYTSIATAGTLAVSATDVVQAWDDGTNLNVKIGSGATASIARQVVSAGTAGYTMGQDNGASSGYFNGRIYSTIYRKDTALTQTEREAVAVYQPQKAKMP